MYFIVKESFFFLHQMKINKTAEVKISAQSRGRLNSIPFYCIKCL